MEELRPEEFDSLVQELEGESDEEESQSPEVENLLRDLQPSRLWLARLKAAEDLGELSESSPRIVQSLVTAGESDSLPSVREAAVASLRAPVHQEILREYPDLVQRTQWAMQATEVHDRKKPADNWQIIPVIVLGVVWIAIVAASGAIKLPWLFALVALPGAAMLAIGLWSWLAASSARNVFLRSMKETVGTVEDLDKKEHQGEYADTHKCFVTVRFDAEDARMGTRVMVLKARVAHSSWKRMKCGNIVGIRYSAENPRLALIEGEW